MSFQLQQHFQKNLHKLLSYDNIQRTKNKKQKKVNKKIIKNCLCCDFIIRNFTPKITVNRDHVRIYFIYLLHPRQY